VILLHTEDDQRRNERNEDEEAELRHVHEGLLPEWHLPATLFESPAVTARSETASAARLVCVLMSVYVTGLIRN
jgi:hypothetical protein